MIFFVKKCAKKHVKKTRQIESSIYTTYIYLKFEDSVNKYTAIYVCIVYLKFGNECIVVYKNLGSFWYTIPYIILTIEQFIRGRQKTILRTLTTLRTCTFNSYGSFQLRQKRFTFLKSWGSKI